MIVEPEAQGRLTLVLDRAPPYSMATATSSLTVNTGPSITKCMPPRRPEKRVDRVAVDEFGQLALGMGTIAKLLEMLPLPTDRWGAILCKSSQQ